MQALERCMDKLTPAQKQSVKLFYLDEKCYKEVVDDNRLYHERGKKLYTERKAQP
jgi:hypothetical protein